MVAMLFIFVFAAVAVHAIGVGAVVAGGRPTGKRVWSVFLIVAAICAGLWALILLGRSGTSACSGDCGLVGLREGMFLGAALAGTTLGCLTMLIHGGISVARFNKRYGSPTARRI